MKVESLPTPIAKCLARVGRSARGRERFDASLLACEALIKYTFCVLVTSVRPFGSEEAYRIEHAVSRAESVGTWMENVDHCTNILQNNQTPDWSFSILKWLTKRRKQNDDCLNFSTLYSSCCILQDALKDEGDHSDFRFSTICDVLRFMIYVRNKVRGHGAKTERFYFENDEHLYNATYVLIDSATVCSIPLESRLLTSLTDGILLSGSTPTERISVPARLEGDEMNTLYLHPPDIDHAHILPPLLKYDPEKDKATFANGGFNLSTGKLEFIDYTTGHTEFVPLQRYSKAAPPKRQHLSGIGAFPTETNISGFVIAQRHSSEAIRLALENLPKGDWEKILLDEAHADLLPRKGGVYCLVSHAHTAGLKAHQVTGYVGKTSDLYQRFRDYLSSKDKKGEREKVRPFVQNFPAIHFWYAVADSAHDRTNLEHWLVKAIDPPLNKQLRIAGRR